MTIERPDDAGGPAPEVAASDGMDYSHPLTKAQLQEMAACLNEFAKNAAGQNDGEEEPRCLLIAGPLGYINPENSKATEDLVAEQCQARFGDDAAWNTEARKKRTINVILDSRGGSLDSAYKSLLYLRRFAGTIRVYVPRHAKSAAMLIALGADEILMSPLAELGPLDTQIRDPRNPSQDFSVLDCYQSVDYVREFGLDTLPMALRVLLSEAPANIQARTRAVELIAEAVSFALGGVTPMLKHVKALDFGSWGRTLKIGEMYARSVLMRLKDDDIVDERMAQTIARQLVYGYTHHPYPIDIEEAVRVGLQVDAMPYVLHKPAYALVEACRGSRFVGFAEDIEEMQKQANGSGLVGLRYSHTSSYVLSADSTKFVGEAGTGGPPAGPPSGVKRPPPKAQRAEAGTPQRLSPDGPDRQERETSRR